MAGTQLEFNHVIVYVKDVPRSLGFYRDRLGFSVIEEMEGYARLRSPRGSSTLALHALEDGQALDPKKEGIRLYFEVEDRDAFCRGVKRAGVPLDQEPRDMEWGWTATRSACIGRARSAFGSHRCRARAPPAVRSV